MSNEIISGEAIPNLNKRSTWAFILLSAITLGIYPIFWIAFRYKKLNELTSLSKKNIGGYWIFIMIVLLFLGLFIPDPANILKELLPLLKKGILTKEKLQMSFYLLSATQWLVMLIPIPYYILAIKIIKKLELYALEKYNKIIEHNSVCLIFFNILYANFAINSFAKRVAKAEEFNSTKEN